jgi:hypothetical protein
VLGALNVRGGAGAAYCYDKKKQKNPKDYFQSLHRFTSGKSKW